MTPLTIDADTHPDVQLRIDSFTVPAAARAEFEAAMHRSAALLETLPGFLGHLAFEKTSGSSAFNIVTIAVWQSREAMASAVSRVQAHYQSIGYNPRATAERLGITAEIDNRYAPLAAAGTNVTKPAAIPSIAS